ncbi:class I SAM-dependent RNA methyltransferase [Magnetospira thiophila]
MKHRPAPRKQPLAAPVIVTVSGLGGRGDGLADDPQGRRLFIPLTLPGDEVEARPGAKRGDGWAAELLRILTPGPHRVVPPCPHFGTCGGCALQHWRADAFAAWKRDMLIQAFSRRGLPVTPEPTRSVGPGTRRRASLRFVRAGGKILLGFHGRGSDRVVDLTVCPLLLPQLQALLDPLRQLISQLTGQPKQGTVQMTACDNGADVSLFWDTSPGMADRESLAVFADQQNLARLNWGRSDDSPPEPVVQRRVPLITLGGVALPLTAGAFLQPSREGEVLLQELVLQGVGNARRVADLYAGFGTFALALTQAKGRVVEAFESDPLAVSTAQTAAGRADRGGNLRAVVRDLERQPLTGPELEGLEALVFDPPRAGAAAQVAEIAPSAIPRVVAVSCNPATLARDARILIDGGYRLEWLVPVDQFTWSAHVEAVALFQREGMSS